MEELRIKVLVVVEHAPDRVEQAAHDGNDRDLLLLATGEQRFVGGFDLRAALDGDQGGHEEREAQVPVAGPADVARGVGGAALAGPRVEPGVGHPLFGFEAGGQREQFAEQFQRTELADAGHAAQPGDLHGEAGLAGGEFGGGLLEGFEPFLQVAEVGLQVGGDEPVAIRGKLDGVQAGLLAGQFAPELAHATTDLLQGEHGGGGRRPRDEVHALEELEDAQGIDRVGLGAGQPGALKVFDRSWIDDHDLHPLGPLQGEREAQAVNAGGFQADAGRGASAGQQLEELAMTGGRVWQRDRGFEEVIAAQRDDQFRGTDIEAGADEWGWFYGLFIHGFCGLV